MCTVTPNHSFCNNPYFWFFTCKHKFTVMISHQSHHKVALLLKVTFKCYSCQESKSEVLFRRNRSHSDWLLILKNPTKASVHWDKLLFHFLIFWKSFESFSNVFFFCEKGKIRSISLFKHNCTLCKEHSINCKARLFHLTHFLSHYNS